MRFFINLFLQSFSRLAENLKMQINNQEQRQATPSSQDVSQAKKIVNKKLGKGKGKEGRLKICLITTGPGKTLGDASLGEKIAADLLKKYNVEIDTRLHLIEDCQKDKVYNLFNHLEQEYPDQHKVIIESGNVGFDQAAFDPDNYDLIIPFAAYNLFEDDFKLKTQFFNDKPDMALIKTENAKTLITSEKFKKNYVNYNGGNGLVTIIKEGKDENSRYFAYLIDRNHQRKLIRLTAEQVKYLASYFATLESDVFHVFSHKDKVRAADFDVSEITDNDVKTLSSKKPEIDNDKKKTYFHTAYQVQMLMKELAMKHLVPVKDKCIYLSRYDFFSDQYLTSLGSDDVEYIGVDRGIKDQFKDVFQGGVIQHIQSGFGRKKIGIMLPKCPAELTLDTKESIKQNMEKEDEEVVDLLYGDKAKEAYEKSHELFFGYHNIIPNTDISALTIKDYITTCLEITRKSPDKSDKNVDFILNICPDNGDASCTCKISEVLQGIDLNKYDIEFWKKNDSNKLEKLQSIGTCDGHKPIVRLINPFGMKNKSFLTLLRIAEPLTLQTGNSSIIEAFYLGKIPLYQLTSWSTDFLDALEQYISDSLGEEAYYTRIFHTANDRTLSQEEKVKRISDICVEHPTMLKSEIVTLVDKIKKEKDLYLNLAQVLKDKFEVPLEARSQPGKGETKDFAPPIVRFSKPKMSREWKRKAAIPIQIRSRLAAPAA